MSKYNKRFNNRRMRYERWYRIEVMLSDAEGLTSPFMYDKASPEEIRCMKEIHRKLCECLTISEFMLKETKIV